METRVSEDDPKTEAPRVIEGRPPIDKGKSTGQTNRPAQKTKKGNPVLIPTKPVLFKKIAQQKLTG